MPESYGKTSPERSLVTGIAVDIGIAFVASRIPMLQFPGFIEVAALLIAADVTVYLAVKSGIIRRRG